MKILITASHPDDIEPQMGGTIAKLTSDGNIVMMVIATIPFEDTNGNEIGQLKEIRRKEAHAAADILGAYLEILEFDAYQLTHGNRELVQAIDKILNDFNPDRVYTQWHGDSHQHHQTLHGATLAACRRNSRDLYMMEPTIPGGSTPALFSPSIYVDISDFIEKKIESISCYRSQLEKEGFGDEWIDASISRTKFHGYRNGVKHAEAFQPIRVLDRLGK